MEARGAVLCKPAYQCQRANCDGFRWQHVADAKGEALVCKWCDTPFPKRPQMRPVPAKQARRALSAGARRPGATGGTTNGMEKGRGKGMGKDNYKGLGKGTDLGKGKATAPKAKSPPKRAPWWRGAAGNPEATQGDVDYDNPTKAQL